MRAKIPIRTKIAGTPILRPSQLMPDQQSRKEEKVMPRTDGLNAFKAIKSPPRIIVQINQLIFYASNQDLSSVSESLSKKQLTPLCLIIGFAGLLVLTPAVKPLIFSGIF